MRVEILDSKVESVSMLRHLIWELAYVIDSAQREQMFANTPKAHEDGTVFVASIGPRPYDRTSAYGFIEVSVVPDAVTQPNSPQGTAP